MDFGFAQSAARPQDGAMSVLGDTDGNQHSTVSETSVDTDFFEAGIEDEVRMSAQRSVVPGVEKRIEFGDGTADSGAGDVQPTLLESGRESLLDYSSKPPSAGWSSV